MHAPQSPPPALRRRAVLSLLAVLLLIPSASRAGDLDLLLRYDLFSDRPTGGGSMPGAAVAADGQVVLVWTGVTAPPRREAVHLQWLSPVGLPLGDTMEIVRGGYPAHPFMVAALPGRRALLVWRVADGPGYRLTAVDADGVVNRRDVAAFGCEDPLALTAAGSLYFLACGTGWPAYERTGWWLGPLGRPLRRVDLGWGVHVTLAGGVDGSVVVLTDDDGIDAHRLFARWLTPRRQGPEVLVTEGPVHPWEVAVAHLGEDLFGLAWLREHARHPDAEIYKRVTAVHAATFRPPGELGEAARVSTIAEGPEEATGEQRRPTVLRLGPDRWGVGWFRCSYIGSPGGFLCFESFGRDSFYLRTAPREGLAAPVMGPTTAVADFGESQVVFTGRILLGARMDGREDIPGQPDRWGLEIRLTLPPSD